MSDELSAFNEKLISVITNDGRNFVGILKGEDQCVNIILDNCQERIYSIDEGVKMDEIGVYLIRGDDIAVIGEVDKTTDEGIDYSSIKSACLPPIVH